MIRLKGVSKKYPEEKKLSLKEISLVVNDQEFFCIVGPSGCGKSTLLKIISDIEEPTLGTVEKPPEVAMVFQSGALFPWITAEENIAFPLQIKGMKLRDINPEVEEYLNVVGLKDFRHKYPRELSGGQRQRVGIARALATHPQLLLLDEPFSALDALTTAELHSDLLKIWQNGQKTVIMVSHSLEEAVELADRVAVMKEGEIKKIVEIDLGRPRNIHGLTFLDQVKAIAAILKE